MTDKNPPPAETPVDSGPSNFIREMLTEQGGGPIVTRFPPEPNGYPHIGHAKAICVNFGMAEEFGGTCNLRFDDTNPEAESDEFVDAIKMGVRWLGFAFDDHLHFTSDYYEQLYGFAVKLVEAGKAYVDSQSEAEIRDGRGDFHRPGENSPHRDRTVDENLDLLGRMRAGEFPDGAHVLRAKIDMAAPNMNMRDPLIYRIRHASHHRTEDAWCIYPMYDFAHGQSDYVEGITHSLCSLEFANHRPLYDWFIEQLFEPPHPKQTEFARLKLSYTVLSKRRLLKLVEGGTVDGWDDPRLPTLSGFRRRGYTPEAIRAFCERIGVARRDGVVDVSLLEHAIREDLNARSPRVMAVLRPLKVVITNFPEEGVEDFDAPYFPDNPDGGSRRVPFSREVFVERDDFREDAPRKWFRLAPGREVRLRYACLITCNDVIKDEAGEVIELHCTWDPQSRGGTAPDGRKVRGTLHWVSAEHAAVAQVRIYDRLFAKANPLEDEDFMAALNPDSLEVIDGARVEPSLIGAEPGHRVQFERLGYFCVDNRDSAADALVFNRTIALRDSWAKIEKAMRAKR